MDKKQLADFIFELGDTKDVIKALKNLAVNKGNYELAANVREIEKEKFPLETLSDELEEDSLNFRRALKLIDIDTNQKVAYSILVTAKKFLEKGNHFDIKDSSEILADSEKYFE